MQDVGPAKMGRPHTAQVAAAARSQTSCQGGSSVPPDLELRPPLSAKSFSLHHHSQDLAFVVHVLQDFRALIGWSILTAPRRGSSLATSRTKKRFIMTSFADAVDCWELPQCQASFVTIYVSGLTNSGARGLRVMTQFTRR